MKAIKVWITFHCPTFWSTNYDYNLRQRQSCKKKCVSKSTAATSSRKVFKKSLGFNKGKKKISNLLLIKYYLCFKGEAGKEYRLVAECTDQALSSVPNTKIQESMNSIWMFSNWLVDYLHFKVSSSWCYVFVCLCLFTWVQYPWSLEGIHPQAPESEEFHGGCWEPNSSSLHGPSSLCKSSRLPFPRCLLVS